MGNRTTHSRLTGFDSFYKLKILPLLIDAQIQRKAAIRKFLWFPAIAFPLGFVFDAFQESESFLFGFGTFAALFICCFAGAIFWVLLNNAIKGEVLPEICRFLDLEYSLTTTGRIGPKRFRELDLLPKWDKINLEDEISGRYRDVEITLLEAKLTEIVQSMGDDEDREERRVVFQGLLIECDFPKSFKGTTTVLSDRLLKGFRKGERVRLEDPEFESRYDVFSDDQVEARFLLTPLFMERIKELDQTSNCVGLQMAFADDKLRLALRMSRDQFEIVSLRKSLVDKQQIKAVAEQICIIFDIVETLSLDNAEY